QHGISDRIQAHRIIGRIGDAELKSLFKTRLLDLRADLHVMFALRNGDVGFYSVVRQITVLRRGGRSVRKWIPARIVIYMVPPDKRIDRQERMRVERVLVAWCNIPGQHTLVLILSQLIVAVWCLDPFTGGVEGQVE